MEMIGSGSGADTGGLVEMAKRDFASSLSAVSHDEDDDDFCSLASCGTNSRQIRMKRDEENSPPADAPLVASCRHLLRPNGSVLGSEVSSTILPLFPSLCSAIPVEGAPFYGSPPAIGSSEGGTSAGGTTGGVTAVVGSGYLNPHSLASIDGRRPISHSRVHDFILTEFGPALHRLGYGRGHRVAVVLPNGPELALAILALCNWCSCVPLNAAGSVAELESDLRGAGAELVIGPYSGSQVDGADGDNASHDDSTNEAVGGGGMCGDIPDKASDCRICTNVGEKKKHRHRAKETHTPHSEKRYAVMKSRNNGNGEFLAFAHVRETAIRLGIPFVGLKPSRIETGVFSLIDDAGPIPKTVTAMTEDADLIGLGDGAGLRAPSASLDSGSSPSGTSDEADVSRGVLSLHAANNGTYHHPHRQIRTAPSSEFALTRRLANTHSDEVLVLFTSGTTGTKKVVPHRLGDMLVSAATICLSWNLTPQDTNCNLMPLFHVGGIVRQVFSPVLSGGCVICCPNFDSSIFWSLLNNRAFNWYYAAPTMHQIIISTGKENIKARVGGRESNLREKVSHPRLRMIANAAGGLLPSLATELRKTFHANVLPSYGMTECMPISSPPYNYQLERPGTSGVAVGPDIAIFDTDVVSASGGGTEPERLLPMKGGSICVRGEPCFHGYGLTDGVHHQPEGAGKESFLPGGWFNTGDLGYLDSDGFLYITGRSKEVINRGGEIISPLEVEEAVVSHTDVLACVAFTAPHDVLQEVVGIAVVPEPTRPRIDLHALHEYLGEGRLAAPKWPQCLVFLDALPKSATNKLLRVKLAQRLGLPELNDGLYPIERTFQARSPPQGTKVDTPIYCERVKVDPKAIQAKLTDALITPGLFDDCRPNNEFLLGEEVIVVDHPSKIGSVVCYVRTVDRVAAVGEAQRLLDRYAMPSHFVSLPPSVVIKTERDLLSYPPKPSDAVSAILQSAQEGYGSGSVDPLVTEIQEAFSDMLGLDCSPHPNTNFFNLGGSSMQASQLAARIRKEHRVPLSGPDIFHHSSCAALSRLIRERDSNSPNGSGSKQSDSATLPNDMTSGSSNIGSFASARKDLDFQGASFSPAHLDRKASWFGHLFQLFPLNIVYPLYEFTRFFTFFSVLLTVLHKMPGERNLYKFLITLFIFHFGWVTVTPIIFVLIKWAIIGRYRPGRYPIWGSYYLRWWFVDVCRKIIGRGIWGSDEVMLNFYYRMLGARIGSGARISLQADLAEFDLVSIGKGAAVETASLRPFGIDNGAMILGPVRVGNRSSAGIKTVVSPNTGVPDGKHLGPQSSSYERGRALNDDHMRFNRYAFPDPHPLVKLLMGHPITLVVNLCSRIPPLMVLHWMIKLPYHRDDTFTNIGDLLEWLCDPRRIPFYIGIRLTRNILSPLFYMAAAVVVKRCVIGRFVPGPKGTSQWQLLRHWLAAKLFSRENLNDVGQIVGRHYEGISIMYRILGAKVGKRVFWPGSNLIVTGEFDLLEIGDDVVFGSRSAVFLSSSDSLEPVRLLAGSNVADNCVVLPGATLGKNAVLGSNGICPGGWYLPKSSVWFGSRGCEPVLLERGHDEEEWGWTPSDRRKRPGWLDHAISHAPERLKIAGDETTLRPFGKAIYNRDASYFVWPISLVVIMNLIVATSVITLQSLPLIGSLYLGAGILYGFPLSDCDYGGLHFSQRRVYCTLLICYMAMFSLLVWAWVMLEVGSKWAVIRRRTEGRYNWDSSSYGQRWELHQSFQRMRKLGRISFLDLINGTPYIAWFFRLNGSSIGSDVCLYPTGADPYMPEPDLVIIGDGTVVDCASIVCHLNTRGNFELVTTIVGSRCTLRKRARIQMGGRMEKGSMLLEHSLAMTGEIVEADSVWYGSPATPVLYLGIPTGSGKEGMGMGASYTPNSYGNVMV